jgi:GxxExxY protein
MDIDANCNETTREIIGAGIAVHRALGPGLLESAYLECLKFELTDRKLRFVTQLPIPMAYKGITLQCGCRVGLIVEDRVVVEVKALDAVLPTHTAQILTYLRLTACPLGLLINFNEARFVDGVHEVVNPVLGQRSA